MRCPFCSFEDSKVVDSRVSKDGEATRRRRECIHCARRFTTYERIEEVAQMVVKKDGRRENFDRWKLKAGIMKAVQKRAVSVEQVDALINDIERELFNGGEREVSTELLGEAVVNRLRQLDEVAYVRFASVYREFRDVSEFMSELQGMMPRSGKTRGTGKTGRPVIRREQ
ncbi:MAG: transcriptional repressor NrdR [Candidatus Hydrogenedentes bacterium]|jgi:transcriptional repressor NrdR|nr:transcriptional repressor NrdR [Candidatus Hydrogenedentota bacterium]